jgi:hypothetical protein
VKPRSRSSSVCLGETPYFVHGHKKEEATRSPLGLATELPVKRLEVRLGKMSVTDFFDLNSIGSDSRLQFLNWSIDNNATYDFAADSRGYAYGALLELYQRGWVLRFAEMFEPKDLSLFATEWNLSRGRSENLELELHPWFLMKKSGAVRVLAFTNHAEMGSYPEAVSAYLSGHDRTPDLAAHTKPGRINYGFGLNAEQELTDYFRCFGRSPISRTGRNQLFVRRWRTQLRLRTDHRVLLQLPLPAWHLRRFRSTAHLESRIQPEPWPNPGFRGTPSLRRQLALQLTA